VIDGGLGARGTVVGVVENFALHGTGTPSWGSVAIVSDEPGPFTEVVACAVAAVAGRRPELSTTGGTSDARFLKAVCPVVEFGLCNATMHKRDEAVAIEDLEVLARIYRRVAEAALAQPEPRSS